MRCSSLSIKLSIKERTLETQLTFGTAFKIAGNVIVIAYNAAMTVPVPQGYTVRIVPELLEAGVKETKAGVKFPARGPIKAILIVDPAFNEVTVRSLDSAWTKVTVAEWQGANFNEDNLNLLLSKIDREGEVAKLLTAFMDDRLGTKFSSLMAYFASLIEDIDMDAMSEEIMTLISANEVAPATISE